MTLTALLELFRHRREGATGVWKLGQEPFRTIFFDAGDVVFAQSSFPADRLTSLLVERGKLTQTQMDYALGNLKQGISIGKNLIEMGFITQRDLLEMARLQVERVVFGAMETADQAPVFTQRELESSVVRLPLDTPLLFLNGILNLKDRESILESLGPLNQVVLLQGRQLQQMTLPADLAKLPPFLDGTHTLLELSREGLAEPLRLGAFALFLREMGWAKLHEMPPVDKQALAQVLSGEAEPLPITVPLPLPVESSPSLFATIEDAARPTTNLEHLSKSLDDLDALPEPPAPQPEPPAEAPALEAQTGFTAESGQAILPTPRVELPPIPEAEEAGDPAGIEAPELQPLQQDSPVSPEEAPVEEDLAPAPEPPALPIPAESEDSGEPEMVLAPETVDPVVVPERLQTDAEPDGDSPEAAPAKGRSWLWILAAIVLIAAAAGLTLWLRGRNRRTATPAELGLDQPVNAALKAPEPQAAPQAAPQAPVPPSEPVPPVQVDTGVEARLAALQTGDTALALSQGARLLEERPKATWTLRLELACQPDTLKRAVELFRGEKVDLFLRPMVLRDGRECFQIFMGNFTSQAAAEKQVSKLPAAFRQDGNRPKAYRMDAIPGNQ